MATRQPLVLRQPSFQFFRLDQVEDIELWGGSHVCEYDAGLDHCVRCPARDGDVCQRDSRFYYKAKLTFKLGSTSWIEEIGYLSCDDVQWLTQDFVDHQRSKYRRVGLAS